MAIRWTEKSPSPTAMIGTTVGPDYWPSSEDPDLDLETDARNATMQYWSEVGWPVRASARCVLLPVERDLLALSVPLPLGWQLLEQLRDDGAEGAVIGMPGGDLRRWVFLAEGQGTRLNPLPPLMVVKQGADVPLPPSILPRGRVEWIARPQGDRRSLFAADEVAAALGAVAERDQLIDGMRLQFIAR